MKKLILTTAAIVAGILALTAFRRSDDPLDKLLSALNRLTTAYPSEKIHLQTDKPYYSVGEDIWFKAYIVDARQNHLSDESKIMYVDLLDERDSVRESLLLPVENGLAHGNLRLNDSLLTAGNYHLIAYTKWMANFSSEYFSKKDISLVDALHGTTDGRVEKTPIKLKTIKQTSSSVADVQFFPEGGRLISGIRTKVGFKALKPDGLGEEVSGYVTEEGSNEHLAEFKSEHAGMGVFAMTPQTNKTYTAVIKYADGSEKHYALPKADESGYVLNVNHVGDSLSVRVSASQELVTGKEAAIIAQCNGVVEFAANINLNKATNVSYIPNKKFRTGITQFTLFDPDYKPVAERLVFVDHNDYLSSEIKTDKTSYNKREKVNLNIDVKDALDQPVIGSFSVAVTDATKVQGDENDETTILSNLLLTSDVKGHIEQPNYYFNAANPGRQKQLDNLLLTQGWRRFSWADIQNNKFPQIKYPHEQSLAISGSITTLGNKPVPKGKVTLFASTGGIPIVIDTIADENGRYTFDNLSFPDSAKVIVRATNAKNSSTVKTTIDKKPRLNYHIEQRNDYLVSSAGLDNYLASARQQFSQQIQAGLMTMGKLLKEVQVKDRQDRDKYIKAKIIPHSSNIDPGNADYVIKPDVLEHETYFLDAFYKVPGVYVSNGVLYASRGIKSITSHGPMLVILDGAQIPLKPSNLLPQVLSTINPKDLIGVEVLLGVGTVIYGTDGNNGVIIVTTKRGDDNVPIDNSFNKAHYSPKGYSSIKEYYSPVYDVANQTQTTDLRSTIYWNPDIITDATGKANLSFYNSDGTGTYKVTLEGMDTKGGLLRRVFTYNVK